MKTGSLIESAVGFLSLASLVGLDLKHIYRQLDSDDATLSNTSNFSSVSIRLNIAARDYSF